MYQQPNAPLSIGGVLDDGFRLAKASFSTVFPLAALGSAAGQIPAFVMGNDPAAMMQDGVGLFLALIAVSTALSVVVLGAVVARLTAFLEGRELTVAAAFGVGLNRFVPLFVASILYMIAIVVGSILLIIPGVIIGLTLIFAPYLVVTDRLGPVAALRTSHNLVWGNWWRTAAILTVVMFIVMVVYFLVGTVAAIAVISSPTEGGTTGFYSILETLVAIAIMSVLTPVVYAFFFATLHDLKLRKKGTDIADRLDALETT